jgi:hypothetical protein
MIERARDELARRAEAQHPGWSLSHGIYGWTGIRACDGVLRRSSSLPGLRPLMADADSLTHDPRERSAGWPSGGTELHSL